jgi:biofilm PGA synthesis protein PgaD
MPEIEIRDNPKLRSFVRNITETGFTGIIWGFWIYMLLPLLNIVLWILGIKYFHVSIIEQAGYKELFNLIGKMGWAVLVIFLVMRIWGYYNYAKFGKLSRRKGNAPPVAERIMKKYNIPAEVIKDLQGKKEIQWPLSARGRHEK